MPHYIIDKETQKIASKDLNSNDEYPNILGIPVIIEKDGDIFIITDHEINMYGVGNTEEEAAEDYKSVVVEYFESLSASEKVLGENLKRHLYYLRAKLGQSDGCKSTQNASNSQE